MKIAFFDVDETIINYKSMFKFLEFFLSNTKSEIKYDNVIEEINKMVKNGSSRVDINTYYYTLFKGIYQSTLKEVSSLFFQKIRNTLFKFSVVNRLKQHQMNGDRVVFVSGAMPDILNPIADYLNVNVFLCSKPEVQNGIYTGKLSQQAIGEQKGILVAKYAQLLNVDLNSCSAYGDHITDQFMLKAVGKACVIDPDACLLQLSHKHNWEVLYTGSVAGPPQCVFSSS